MDLHPLRICPKVQQACDIPEGPDRDPPGGEITFFFFFSCFFWKSFIWDVQFSSLSLWGCDTHRQSWVQALWALCWEAKPPRAMPNPLAPQLPSGHLTFAFYIPHFLLDIPISISLSDYFNFEKLNHHLPNFNSHNLFLWGDAEKGKNNEYFEWCGSQLCAFPEISAACKGCKKNHWKKIKNKKVTTKIYFY